MELNVLNAKAIKFKVCTSFNYLFAVKIKKNMTFEKA